LAMFVLSMVAFVVGFRSLRLRDASAELFRRPFPDDYDPEDRPEDRRR